MLKPILVSVALIVCVRFSADAQTDTSSYDLGRVSVRKQFTQSITIKGSDLERTQFSNLADAINVWAYGTYTNSTTLVYVVDGNIINDVNAYSIYDVDEITLVQSALAQVSGAGPGTQMVLIKLKTNHPGKQGIEAAGQSSLVNLANRPFTPGYKSVSQVYDQYYLSGYKNFDAVQMGLSVDYQRDVLPVLTNSNFVYSDLFHFNRFKLNAYANAKLWKGTTVNFNINYTPQTHSFAYDYSITYPNYPIGESFSTSVNGAEVQHYASSNIAINSNITKGLTNTLSVAYAHYNSFLRDSIPSVVMSSGNPNENALTLIGQGSNISNILLRDNLVYHAKLGVFDIEPSLNFSFRKYDESYRDSSYNLVTSNGPPSLQVSEESGGYNSKLYLLTPSLNISYKNMLNLQGGLVSLLNSGNDFNSAYPLSRIFPFLSASVDVFKLAGVNQMSLAVFGSLSRESELLEDPYALLSGYAVSNPINQGTATFTTNLSNIPVLPYSDFNPLKALNNYQAGLALGLSKNFSIGYNFAENYGGNLAAVYIPYGTNGQELVYEYYYSKVSTNRIGLNYVYTAGNFTWRTGLNVAQQKLSTVDPNFNNAGYADYLSKGHRYSGGFTNRFTYKTLFAGFDILYQLGERPIGLENISPNGIVSPPGVNSVSLQSLYFGSQVKIRDLRYAEVFANFRNIAQNNSGDITDNRRFYGLGIKVAW